MIRHLLLTCALLATATPAASAQIPDQAQSRQKLEEIKREREKLEAQQRKIQGQVNDVDSQLRNIEAQRQATARMVNIIEQQIGGLGSQLDRSAAELALAQDNLTERKAVLNRRLSDIYKRGPLHTFQVLLTAESFGDLLARYKYLYLTSRQDKLLMEEVRKLTGLVREQHSGILDLRTELERKQLDREAEIERFSDLADEQSLKLSQLKRTSAQTSSRITTLKRDEAALSDVLASIARAARANAAKPGAAPSIGKLTTADIGKLDWPVEGDILFQFGPDSLETGGVVFNNGIGIGAPTGTPVTAIAAGTVVRVANQPGYGLAVFLQHGDSHYSLYMQLQKAIVKTGQQVGKGEVLGTVGGSNTSRGSHLYFEIRGPNQIALDPATWLRSRRR